MKIHVIRHGETDWNKTGQWQGQKDIPLNATGEKQAALLASYLARYNIKKIYTSPLVRAHKTADIVASATKAKVTARTGLAELNFGKWESLTTDQIKSDYSELFALWEEDPNIDLTHSIGIESRSALRKRTLEEFETLRTLEKEDFAVVSHGAWIRALVCTILEIPNNKRLLFNVNNTSVTTIKYTKSGNYKIMTLNNTSHLR